MTGKINRHSICFFALLVLILLLKNLYFEAQIGAELFCLSPFVVRLVGSYLCFSILLIIPFACLRQKRWSYIIIILLDVWIEGNLMYFRSYGDLLNRWCLQNVSAMEGVWGSLWVFVRPGDLCLLVSSLIWIAAVEYFAHRHPDCSLVKVSVAGLVVALFCFLPSLAALRMLPFDRYYADLSMGRVWYAQSYGIIPHFVNECIGLTRDSQSDVIPVTDDELKEFFDDSVDVQPTEEGNVLVVFFESLESDVVGQAVGGEEVTPFLNSLIANPHTQYYTLKPQVRQGKSSDAQLIYFSGLLPVYDGATSMRYARNLFPSWVADYPAKVRYAFLPTPADLWNQSAFLPALGFDTVWGKEMSDWSMACLIREKIVSVTRPFLLFHTTMASHAPFVDYADSSDITFAKVADSDRRNYLRCVHYTDSCLRYEMEFILNDSLLSRNTRILVVGDHPMLNLNASVPMIWYDPTGNQPIDTTVRYQADLYTFLHKRLHLCGRWKGFGDKPLPAKDSLYWKKANDLSDRIIRSNHFTYRKIIQE